MKKIILFVLCCVLLVGCGGSGVSQNEYDKVVAERDKIQEDYNRLLEEYEKMQAEMAKFETLNQAEIDENQSNEQTEDPIEDQYEEPIQQEADSVSEKSAYEKGEELGNELIEKMDSIDWGETYKEAEDAGKKAADFLNGLMGD